MAVLVLAAAAGAVPKLSPADVAGAAAVPMLNPAVPAWLVLPLEKVKPPGVPEGAVLLLLLAAEPKAKPDGAAAWLEGVLVAAGAPKEKPPVIAGAGVAVLAPKVTFGVFALGKKRKERKSFCLRHTPTQVHSWISP